MQFSSLTDFLHMGGYAFYVWFSYGAAAVLVGYLILNSFKGHRTLLTQIAARQNREQRMRKAAEKIMSEKGLSYPDIPDNTSLPTDDNSLKTDNPSLKTDSTVNKQNEVSHESTS